MKNTLREKLFGFFYTISLWFRILKMRLSWLFSRLPNKPVTKYTEINQIPETLKWGSQYLPDPPRDPVYHPRKIQDRISHGHKIGDCDDHAIYWCTAIHKSKLAKNVWLALYFYTRSDGTEGGHAICVFEGFDGKFYWGDYNTPTPVEIDSSILPDKFNWLETAMQRYGAVKIKSAAMFKIKRLNKNDTPILRKPIYVHKRTLEDIISSAE